MVPIINTLRKVINMNLTIMLNCVDNLSELPVKAFYRFVLNHEPAASVDKLPKDFKEIKITNKSAIS